MCSGKFPTVSIYVNVTTYLGSPRSRSLTSTPPRRPGWLTEPKAKRQRAINKADERITVRHPASMPTDSGSTFRPTKFPPSAAAAAASARFELGEADETECMVVCGAEAEVREVLSRAPAQVSSSASAEYAWIGTSGLSPFAQLGDIYGRATVIFCNLNTLAQSERVIFTPRPRPLSQLTDIQCCCGMAGERVL